MPVLVALLRAVNVGGTGKLPMAELRSLCEAAGFDDIRTYIQSGNVVFHTALTADAAKTALEARLRDHLGKPVGVIIRTGEALRDILAANPFPAAAPNQVAILFLDNPPPQDAAALAKGRTDERIEPGLREIYIHYPSGMGRSRLRLPAMDQGTARNLNTVARLAAMAAGDG